MWKTVSREEQAQRLIDAIRHMLGYDPLYAMASDDVEQDKRDRYNKQQREMVAKKKAEKLRLKELRHQQYLRAKTKKMTQHDQSRQTGA